jgi:hypothetical protein
MKKNIDQIVLMNYVNFSVEVFGRGEWPSETWTEYTVD